MPWAEDTTNSGPDLPRWGRYVLRARLGEGAQGAVFCAWDPQLECDVALKVVSLESSGGLVSDSMLREARALARVRNPHVVNVYNVEAHEGKIGLCMELIKGRTLDEMLRTQGRFGAREAATAGLDSGVREKRWASVVRVTFGPEVILGGITDEDLGADPAEPFDHRFRWGGSWRRAPWITLDFSELAGLR